MDQIYKLCDHQVELILVGDSGVGKSSLLLRFIEDNFHERNVPTIGVDFRVKTCLLNDQTVRLRIWDTAGQERFRSLNYKKADGVVLVYDVTNKESFDGINKWVDEIRKACSEYAKIILVGNKNENVLDKHVMTSEGEKFAKNFDLGFIETSSKLNEHVEEMFHTVASAVLLKKLQLKDLENRIIIHHRKHNENKLKCC